jgi:hypothetical protein
MGRTRGSAKSGIMPARLDSMNRRGIAPISPSWKDATKARHSLSHPGKEIFLDRASGGSKKAHVEIHMTRAGAVLAHRRPAT